MLNKRSRLKLCSNYSNVSTVKRRLLGDNNSLMLQLFILKRMKMVMSK